MRRDGATNPPGCSKHTKPPGTPPRPPPWASTIDSGAGGSRAWRRRISFFLCQKKNQKTNTQQPTPHTPTSHCHAPQVAPRQRRATHQLLYACFCARRQIDGSGQYTIHPPDGGLGVGVPKPPNSLPFSSETEQERVHWPPRIEGTK